MMNDSYAYSEVLEILSNMDQQYVDKIPKKLIDYFNDNSSENYIKHINPQVDLKEQNLSKKTLDILALINLKYWTKNEEHRKKLLKQYSENEKKSQEEKVEKYNPDKLFKNKQKDMEEVPNSEKISLIVYKENLFTQIINKIKNFFARLR